MPTPATRHLTYTTGVGLIKTRWSMVTACRGSRNATWGCSTGRTAKSLKEHSDFAHGVVDAVPFEKRQAGTGGMVRVAVHCRYIRAVLRATLNTIAPRMSKVIGQPSSSANAAMVDVQYCGARWWVAVHMGGIRFLKLRVSVTCCYTPTYAGVTCLASFVALYQEVIPKPHRDINAQQGMYVKLRF